MKTDYFTKAIILPCALLLAVSGCNDAAQSGTDQAVDTEHVQQVLADKLSVNDLNIWPELNFEVKKNLSVEAKVSQLLAQMTIEQKVAQMIQPEIRDITPEDMRKYGFGSFLNGGGSFPNNNKHASVQDWIALAEAMYQASIDDSIDGSTIPTIWGTDAVHGHNNVIGATLFPHNIGLGAANNPKLLEQVAAITAKAVMVTGIDWVFAPTVAVVRDDRWGRTYEGYSEDPAIVREYSAAIVKGLQGRVGNDFLSDERVISTVKHFLGDGGTVGGDDQGNNIDSEQALFDIHGQGYVGGLQAGSQSVMASFNSWHGKKNHGSKYLLTDVLKNKMGFDGFVVGDWNGHGQVAGCTNESCPQAINAGLDIFMVATKAWKPLYENTVAQVKAGEISMARIDDAVSRILRVKVRAGIFTKPSPKNRVLSGKTELIGALAHRQVARQAVRESLVLLKNKNNLLPLATQQNVLVAGDGADNIAKQSGGWSVTWQGTNNTNAEFPDATSIFQGIKQAVAKNGGSATLSVDGSYTEKPEVAIVVFGEDPYAEGHGDRDNLEFQRGNKSALQLLKKFQGDGIPVVALFISGRPMWVNAELNASDAFVAVWLPGTEGQGISDVIFSKASGDINYDFNGKLSFSWPKTAQQSQVNRFDADYAPLLPYGFGLQYGDENVLADHLDETIIVNKNLNQAQVIFNGTVQLPWRMELSSGLQNEIVNNNVQSLGAVKIRATDKVVQEDALQINFDGSALAKVAFTSNFTEDLRALKEADAALTFAVKVSEKPKAELMATMICETGCQGSIALNKTLASVADGQWHNLAIDLQCFAQAGADLAKITSALTLETKGEFSLVIADIAITPKQAANAVIKCQ
ncbi:MAG: glycoside hydrolase family 3 protein [Thalassotalea sp.]